MRDVGSVTMMVLVVMVMVTKNNKLVHASSSSSSVQLAEQRVARDFVERTLLGLESSRRPVFGEFGNSTELVEGKRDDEDGRGTQIEARGKKKQLKQMNRTLMAVVMAYTLKFMFLIPTLVGSLVLFKFTAGLAGFFYALFAAVLGLDHPNRHDR